MSKTETKPSHMHNYAPNIMLSKGCVKNHTKIQYELKIRVNLLFLGVGCMKIFYDLYMLMLFTYKM